MRRHLHHLNALRFFEAAARHLSFTSAAAELCVTQAAVSHQVRALEQALGQPLFLRQPRQVRLTAAGERLLGVAAQSFDRIEQLLAQLKAPASSAGVLQLTLTPSFSSRWLMPRLPRFWAAQPDIELHLQHRPNVAAHELDAGQAAIVWAREQPASPRLWARRLFGTALTPVCAPSLIRATYPLATPSALAHYPLLHEDDYRDWNRWLAEAAPTLPAARSGPVIDDSNALLVAAVSGQGVALGRLALIGDELRNGRLLRPFPHSIAADGAY